MGHLPHRGRPSPGRAVPSYAPRGVCLGEVVAQVAAARRGAELAQRPGLGLADPLAGDIEVLAHLLERVILAIDEPKAHLEHLTLALGEHGEGVLYLLLDRKSTRLNSRHSQTSY